MTWLTIAIVLAALSTIAGWSLVGLRGRLLRDRRALADAKRALAAEAHQRLDALRELRESQSRFQEFAGAAADWLWEIDTGYRFTMDTGSAPRGGLIGAELIGLRRWEMPGVDPADPVWDRYRALLDARESFRSFEFSYAGKDGRRHHASISGHPLYAPDGTFIGYRGTARDITSETEAKEHAARTTALLDAVRLIQLSYIGDADPKQPYEKMLATVLDVTKSAYGFVGEIEHDECGAPYLRAHAITNIAWNDETRRLYADSAVRGFEFRNLNTLFGAAITSGKPVIANDPATDPRRGRRPEGHPPLDCFLGVPLYSGQEMVGLMGVANRPGGYDEAIVAFLEPLAGACGSVIAAIRADAQQAGVEAALRETVNRLNAAERHAHLGSWEADLASGEMIVSDAMLAIFAQPPGTRLTREVFFASLAEEDRERVRTAVEAIIAGTRTEYEMEYRVKRRAGDIRRIFSRAAVERTVDGTAVRLRGIAQDMTELRAVEADLRASQERLNLALEGTGVGLWDWTIATGEFKFDRHALERMGYGVDEIDSSIRAWDSLVHPDDLPTATAASSGYLAGQSDLYQAIYRIRTKSGDWRWILSRGRAVERLADGRPRRLSGTHLDITDLKQIEVALRRSDQRFRALAESSRAVPWEADIATNRITYVGPQIETVVGFSAADWVEKDLWPERLHPDDRDRALREAAEYSRSGVDHNLEYRLIASDGRIVWIRDLVSVIKSDDGQTWLYGAMVDITEEKQIEQTLRDSEARYRQAERVAGLIHWTIAGNPTSGQQEPKVTFSDTAAAFFGLPKESLPETTSGFVEQVVHPDDREKLSQAIDKLIQEGTEEFTLEYRIQRSDGSVAVVSEIGRRLLTDEGRFQSGFGTIQDITERKQAEDALRRAQMDAEIANRAKSQFLANVSHELRTPLNAIIGFSEIMNGEMMGPLGSSIYKEYASDIHGSGRHLLAIINDILDLSRVEAGQVTLNESAIGIQDLLSSCLILVRGRANEGGLTLSVEAPLATPEILGDERLLKQALLNLLSNAIKFTPKGGAIRIATRVSRIGLEIAVSDSGIGMSESELAKVAKPFVQLENWLVRKYEGTGLGLSIAKAFCELHGGRLEIVSATGEGTTATIHLPASRIASVGRIRARAR
ncbi:MAG TPA: PAS domain-containing protein [Dongiaceae bacterium]|nr:PAS domain-containing protein [Dongiaceae bacterium]